MPFSASLSPAPRLVALSRMLVLLGVSGCAVGPDFSSPPPPEVERFTPEPIATLGGDKGVKLVDDDIPQRWWEVFHNKNLNRLVKAAIEHNPSLQAAQASIKIAYYNAEAQKGGFLPQILFGSNDSLSRQASPVFNAAPNGPSNPYGLFLKQLTVSYTPDIWGQNIRAVESLEAQTDQQRYQLEAAYLVLTANVVTAAIQEASLRGQIAAIRKVIAVERELLDLLRKQYRAGSVAEADVLTQESALAQSLQLLPPLEKQLAQQRDLLTALAGQYSTAEVPETFQPGSMALPRQIPLSLPSKVVRQRPDVRAAEASMHSASAQIGVAIAARLPNLTLSANGGFSAFKFAQLFAPGTGFYTLAANVAQPIFDGFTLLNKQKAAEAGLVQADAQYRQAVVTAFQNVSDALRALQADTKAVKAAAYSEQVSNKNLYIVKAQLRLGSVSVLSVLNAQQTYLLALTTRVQAEGNRLADVAGLFMALGGGWSDQKLRDLPPNGPESPRPEQTDAIQGPVNSSWLPDIAQ